MLLRRAFSIHDVRPDHGGTVEFVFSADGPGHPVAGRAPGQGRAGRHRAARPAVPGARATRSAACWSAAATAARRCSRWRAGCASGGCTVDFLLGAATGDRVFGALTARRTGRTATITTEDGSLGVRGIVTDMMGQVIHEARTDVIYACGPMPMLRQVTALARRYDIPVQVAVEEVMACGIGVCMTCVLPVVGTDGITRMVRSCVDGPVFRGERVRWDDVGTIPFDAFGAPGWEPRSRRAAGPVRARGRRAAARRRGQAAEAGHGD